MRERYIEQQLVKAVKKRGGICAKWVSPGLDGVPDRIVLLPEGHVGFVELKAPGERPRPLQIARMEQMKRLGYKCFVCDRVELIDGILDGIENSKEAPDGE